MAERSNPVGEGASLGQFVKSQGYGTIRPTLQKQVDGCYVKHCVKLDDTLQGIALFYGVTIEQIKRANNTWTNDSIHLYEHLLIPLPADEAASRTNVQSGKSEPLPTPTAGDGIIIHKQRLSRKSQPARDPSEKSSKAEPIVSGSDFFSKLDNSLAQIKSNVDRLEGQTSFPADATNPLTHLSPRRPTRHRPRSEVSLLSEPDLVFVSGRLARPPPDVRTSQENLQRQEQDLYKL